ncbi:MAG: hypothetical protein RDV48_23830 [Candidatus Eremiobacteraeota bacterium]|nr:hypothetical protein [Candidatus Eremiobacteraeota bacterium]
MSDGKVKAKEPSPAAGIITFVIFFLIFTQWERLAALWNTMAEWLASRGITPGLALAGKAVVFIALPAALFLAWVKSAIMKAFPEKVTFTEASPDEYPAFDHEAFERYTEAFESLGFKRLIDYHSPEMEMQGIKGIGRLFSHDRQFIFAECNQNFPPGRNPTEVKCVLVSFMTDGFSFSTTDRKPDGVTYAMRRPRSLWVSLPPASPGELFNAHLERRNALEKELKARLLRESSAQGFFEHEKKEHLLRKEALGKRNIVAILYDIIVTGSNPPFEWMGEYGGRLQDRSKS